MFVFQVRCICHLCLRKSVLFFFLSFSYATQLATLPPPPLNKGLLKAPSLLAESLKTFSLSVRVCSLVPSFVNTAECCYSLYDILGHTAELHLSGLIGTASHPDMQEIRIIGFFSENTLHWQIEGATSFYNRLL